MAKSKEDLLAEAKELGLEVTEENTVAEIKAAIADVTPENEPDEVPQGEESDEVKGNGAGDGREPQITSEPEKSFEERTGVGTPPWLNEDGTQNTGE